ncbi:hypothetical protein V9T40_001755 [Parthenolecanium corni]|uniref:Uncharacterized protein n=1 Tax=Parthenolecanium corni TaxID=536013 RepID=A0AAN9TT98_9HEMI
MSRKGRNFSAAPQLPPNFFSRLSFPLRLPPCSPFRKPFFQAGSNDFTLLIHFSEAQREEEEEEERDSSTRIIRPPQYMHLTYEQFISYHRRGDRHDPRTHPGRTLNPVHQFRRRTPPTQLTDPDPPETRHTEKQFFGERHTTAGARQCIRMANPPNEKLEKKKGEEEEEEEEGADCCCLALVVPRHGGWLGCWGRRQYSVDVIDTSRRANTLTLACLEKFVKGYCTVDDGRMQKDKELVKDIDRSLPLEIKVEPLL